LVGTTVGILVGALLLSCTSEADGDNDAASSLVNWLVGVNVVTLVGDDVAASSLIRSVEGVTLGWMLL